MALKEQLHTIIPLFAFTRSLKFLTAINIVVMLLYFIIFMMINKTSPLFSLTTVRGHAGRGAVVRALTWGPSVQAGLQDDSGGALSPRTTAC